MTLNTDAVRRHAKLKIGSYLNSPTALDTAPANGSASATPRLFSALEWRRVIAQIQEIFLAVNGGHPVLYGIDSVHGAVHVRGALIFGQQINTAATFNPELAFAMARITSRDTLAAGIPWIFSPILDISQNPLWPRTFETFGEDPHLAAVMADAVVRGLQHSNRSAACMKHVIGYSKTPTGHDREGVTLSDFDLLNYFAPPYLAAIRAGAMSAMESYISINGAPVVANSKILQALLRHDMGFDGLLVTDWGEINNLYSYHRVAATEAIAVDMALSRTSIDLSMVPYNTSFVDLAKSALERHPGLLERVKTSARRVLKLKSQLGLYRTPVPGAEHVGKVGQTEDKEVALQLARESIIVLKNQDGLLPLRNSSNVFLTGHAADDVGLLCGGWSLVWQGVAGNSMFPNGVSLKQGMERVASRGAAIRYFNALNASGAFHRPDLKTAKELARAAGVSVIAIGEAPYAEKPGDIEDLALPAGQVEYVREIAATGTKVVLVLVQGRPRLLSGLAELAHAVVFAMLPGEVGGQALAEVLYGDVNPSGRLPITYPKHPASAAIPYNHLVTTRCGDRPCETEWAFGHGLSYTSFTYNKLTLDKVQVSNGTDERLRVSVTVTNTGPREGKETVLLFLTQLFRAMSVPEVKQLKQFRKVALQPGEAQEVSFELTHNDWSAFEPQIGQGFHKVAESGAYAIAVKPETDCKVYDEPRVPNPLCAWFSIA
ncbi:hypothetical protein PybrP1_004067 [[Pythium] brassicae (nom. inval.)]|nr:hypothetical protein PybrP1_004067 [[Pythium] brassicae (nom. inval.)]